MEKWTEIQCVLVLRYCMSKRIIILTDNLCQMVEIWVKLPFYIDQFNHLSFYYHQLFRFDYPSFLPDALFIARNSVVLNNLLRFFFFGKFSFCLHKLKFCVCTRKTRSLTHTHAQKIISQVFFVVVVVVMNFITNSGSTFGLLYVYSVFLLLLVFAVVSNERYSHWKFTLLYRFLHSCYLLLWLVYDLLRWFFICWINQWIQQH